MDCNTGNRNTGDYNTGDYNTGNFNTGDFNAGNRNAGNFNAGNRNAGFCNTGNFNTGNRNTGNFNTGNFNAGFCNSITPDDCYIFNKPSKRSLWEKAKKPEWMYVELSQWVYKGDMSDEEKEAHPSYATTGGYLKTYPDLRSAFIDSWENTTEEDRELTKQLPNFDPVEFEKVFGFNPFKEESKEPETIEINGKKYTLIEVNND
jgi:hypothetical protein